MQAWLVRSVSSFTCGKEDTPLWSGRVRVNRKTLLSQNIGRIEREVDTSAWDCVSGNLTPGRAGSLGPGGRTVSQTPNPQKHRCNPELQRTTILFRAVLYVCPTSQTHGRGEVPACQRARARREVPRSWTVRWSTRSTRMSSPSGVMRMTGLPPDSASRPRTVLAYRALTRAMQCNAMHASAAAAADRTRWKRGGDGESEAAYLSSHESGHSVHMRRDYPLRWGGRGASVGVCVLLPRWWVYDADWCCSSSVSRCSHSLCAGRGKGRCGGGAWEWV
ncbi:hypothetical protein CALCODRAFT_367619 [Calocera cornea HHB12733]|uniref:Uncharacterized protein n=1 Tax=Calocera cornea HHB12733 TaxID=1353952 RepID=A0A165JB22_9BASI|nr:hypothetical protein CALCODRAFT_367619 [Calocera cornea HHB12733]